MNAEKMAKAGALADEIDAAEARAKHLPRAVDTSPSELDAAGNECRACGCTDCWCTTCGAPCSAQCDAKPPHEYAPARKRERR